MPSITSFTVIHDEVNEERTFSEGDPITGKVILVLANSIEVQSLFVKVTGDADVRWTRKQGDHTHTYSAHRRYFKLKEFLTPQGSKATLQAGNHVYPFSFTIPNTEMPSSFKGCHGKIVYKLEAKMSRSWKLDRTVTKELTFVSKRLNLHSAMSQQVGTTKKEMGIFSKGHVDMDVILDRMAYAPGDTMRIVAKINNASSSEMTPKFSLTRSVEYRANGSTKHEKATIEKVAEKRMKARTQSEVQCTMKIPQDLMLTISNCEILSVEYCLTAYLDISFSFDPEVVFPVVIVPRALTAGLQHPVATGPYAAGNHMSPSHNGFPPPAAPMGPYPAYSPSGSPGYPGAQRYPAPQPTYSDNPPMYAGLPNMYPPQPAQASGGLNNAALPLDSPYGTPFSAASSSSVLHPPPSVPTFHPPPSAPEIHPPPSAPFYQYPTPPSYNVLPSAPGMNMDFLGQPDEPPPEYSLLFPSSDTNKSDKKQ